MFLVPKNHPYWTSGHRFDGGSRPGSGGLRRPLLDHYPWTNGAPLDHAPRETSLSPGNPIDQDAFWGKRPSPHRSWTSQNPSRPTLRGLDARHRFPGESGPSLRRGITGSAFGPPVIPAQTEPLDSGQQAEVR